ncbi:hypothetical protein Nepgr_014868 [Nepenthes gracilis]|uniref:Uncharacterized protein n=1 Tax=Nepenthes gracilis TaxID=150966 RepID=A0AAD3SKU6_NEPGR|nr:hypothetical protein Nepgr_014868 [Nepenthes gracilis]
MYVQCKSSLCGRQDYYCWDDMVYEIHGLTMLCLIKSFKRCYFSASTTTCSRRVYACFWGLHGLILLLLNIKIIHDELEDLYPYEYEDEGGNMDEVYFNNSAHIRIGNHKVPGKKEARKEAMRHLAKRALKREAVDSAGATLQQQHLARLPRKKTRILMLRCNFCSESSIINCTVQIWNQRWMMLLSSTVQRNRGRRG